MSVWRVLWRSSSVLPLLIVIVPLSWLFALSQTELWLGAWEAASAHIAQASIVLATVGAAATAWDVARWRRARVTVVTRSGTRRRSALVVRQVGSAYLWILLPYFLVILLVASRVRLGDGHLNASLVVLGAGVILVHCWLGAALGRVLPPLLAPPIAFLVSYLWLIWVEVLSGSSGTAHLSVFPDSCCGYDAVYPTSLLRGQILWLLGSGLLLAIVATLQGEHHLREVGMAVAAVGLAVIGGVQASALPANAVTPRPVSTPACQQTDGIKLCVWPEQRGLLSTGASVLAVLHGPVAGLAGVPTLFAASGAVDDKLASLVPIPAMATPTAELAVTWSTAVLPPVPACHGMYPGGLARPIVAAVLLAGQPGAPTPLQLLGPTIGREAQAVLELPPAPRQVYLKWNVAAMSRCDVAPHFLTKLKAG